MLSLCATHLLFGKTPAVMTEFDIHEYENTENLTLVNGHNAIDDPFQSVSTLNDLRSTDSIWMSFDDSNSPFYLGDHSLNAVRNSSTASSQTEFDVMQLFSTGEDIENGNALTQQTQLDDLYSRGKSTEQFVEEPSNDLLDALEYPLDEFFHHGPISATTMADIFMTAQHKEITTLDNSALIEEMEPFRGNPMPSNIFDNYNYSPHYFEHERISGGDTIESPMTSTRSNDNAPSILEVYEGQDETRESGAVQNISDLISQIEIAPTSHTKSSSNMPTSGQMVLEFSKPKRYLLQFLTKL
jgi:hypothetical protein